MSAHEGRSKRASGCRARPCARLIIASLSLDDKNWNLCSLVLFRRLALASTRVKEREKMNEAERDENLSLSLALLCNNFLSISSGRNWRQLFESPCRVFGRPLALLCERWETLLQQAEKVAAAAAAENWLKDQRRRASRAERNRRTLVLLKLGPAPSLPLPLPSPALVRISSAQRASRIECRVPGRRCSSRLITRRHTLHI